MWVRWSSAWWIACAMGTVCGTRPPIACDDFTAHDIGVLGHELPARAEAADALGELLTCDRPIGHRLGQPFAGEESEVALR